MYCPSCGIEITQKLSYCNRCGANLAPALNERAAPPARSNGAVWAISLAITFVTTCGFGMIFAFVMELIGRGSKPSEEILALAAVTLSAILLAMLVIDWLLIRQLSRALTGALPSADTPPTRRPNWELSGQQPARLDAPREPLSSVAEDTTRTLEPVYKERNTS